jgi:hypothetical protein
MLDAYEFAKGDWARAAAGSLRVMYASEKGSRIAVVLKLSADKGALEQEQKSLVAIRKIAKDAAVECLGLVGAGPGRWALVLERGESSLRELMATAALRASRWPSPRELLADVKRLMDVVQAVHKAGLVWLDCKPENFVLFNDHLHFTLKAVDFHSAVRSGDSLPDKCTPGYCAPEVAREILAGNVGDGVVGNVVATSAIDCFALGLLLLELYQGTHFLASEICAEAAGNRGAVFARLASPSFPADLAASIGAAFPEPEQWILRDVLLELTHANPLLRPSLASARSFLSTEKQRRRRLLERGTRAKEFAGIHSPLAQQAEASVNLPEVLGEVAGQVAAVKGQARRIEGLAHNQVRLLGDPMRSGGACPAVKYI